MLQSSPRGADREQIESRCVQTIDPLLGIICMAYPRGSTSSPQETRLSTQDFFSPLDPPSNSRTPHLLAMVGAMNY